MHPTNITEHCLCTWKNHFMAMQAGAPPSFCMANWCRMTEQCDITLNMMRPCTLNPLLSAFEAMEGMYSFDDTPMAPVGTEMLMHLKPVRRHSWGYHTLKTWYFAPALKHHRVVKGVTKSGAVRLTDTWKFKHHAISTPTITPVDRITKATRDLNAAINGHTTAPPDELDAIQQLHALIVNKPVAPPPAAATPPD